MTTVQHPKTAESRGKTAHPNTHSGTMEGQQKTAPAGASTPVAPRPNPWKEGL